MHLSRLAAVVPLGAAALACTPVSQAQAYVLQVAALDAGQEATSAATPVPPVCSAKMPRRRGRA